MHPEAVPEGRLTAGCDTPEDEMEEHEEEVVANPCEVADVVSEADGIRLHLSAQNSLGYTGVSRRGKRFKAKKLMSGRYVYLGGFETAVAAAVAYARYVMKGGAEDADSSEDKAESELWDDGDGKALEDADHVNTNDMAQEAEARPMETTTTASSSTNTVGRAEELIPWQDLNDTDSEDDYYTASSSTNTAGKAEELIPWQDLNDTDSEDDY